MQNTQENDAYVQQLSESLADELVGAVGLPKNRFTHWFAWRFFHRMMDPLAKIGVVFERLVQEEGLPAASKWVLSLFCNPINVEFQSEIPREGPLLVAVNHPGAYDALIIFSLLARNDIHWISTEIPFLKLLPNTNDHAIVAPRNDSTKRMVAMRNIIRHLNSGGTMVYFPSGHRDPDPAVYPGSEASIDSWLDVFNMFYKYVPGLKIVPAICSGIVSEKWAYHSITRLRRKQIDKHRLAEFGQVITQMLHPGQFMVTPSASIGTAVSQEELQREGVESDFQSALIARGKALLHDHAARFDCSYL